MIEDRSADGQSEPFGPVTTARLCLRCVREDDAAALAALMTPAISLRLASWPARLSVEAARERIRQARLAAMATLAVPLALERRADGALAGWFSATRATEDSDLVLLTYWLGEPFQGAGLMREAAPPALALALDRLRPRRVRAAVQDDNDPSLSIVRLLGLRALGPGRIWCAARGREEGCLWFGLACGEAAGTVAVAAE